MSEPPVSVKGVLVHDDRVLLLLNKRGEWELPGGRPDVGEDDRAALKREVREETGLCVEVGEALGEHLFEVLPGRIVRIVAFGCQLRGGGEIAVSDEHIEIRWQPIAELAACVDGHGLPAGYLAAIRTFVAAVSP
jgi:8-oxo-dGTP pyrophosphatase MutT (NUDIX family)